MKTGFVAMLAQLKRTHRLILSAGLILSLAMLMTLAGNAGEATTPQQHGPYLVLIGAPGAGKSINGAYISQHYGVPSIEVRKILQDEIARASSDQSPPGAGQPESRRYSAWSERNRRMAAAMKKLKNGELVSDNVINSSVLARLLQDDAKNGFVLDGYPGSVEQAVYLDGLLAARGIDSLQIILLDVADEIALERMGGRGRADDKSGFAQQRLALFRTSIGPVLEYYRDGSLHVVDASKNLAAVQAEIDRILRQKNHVIP